MPDVYYSPYPDGLPSTSIRLPCGIRLACRISNGGDLPLILLHGFPLSSSLWEKTQILFPPRYASCAPDLRGCGNSDKTNTGYSPLELAEDLLHVMKNLKIRQAVLVGHSSGGFIAQHFAVNHPDRVSALVLVNSPAGHLAQSGMMPQFAPLADLQDGAFRREQVIRDLIAGYGDPSRVAPEDMGRILEMALMADLAGLSAMQFAFGSTPPIPAERFSMLKLPTLVVVGAHDPFDSFAHAVALSDVIPRSRIAVMARCSHLPMWEKPIEFVKTITEFFSERLPKQTL